MAEFLQQLINGIALGSIYGLIAVGYTIVYGILGLINFAHGEIYMVGTFAAFFAVSQAQSRFGMELGFLPALGYGMLYAALMGVLVERIAYRPLRAASPVPAVLLGGVGGGVCFLLLETLLLPLPIRFESPIAWLARLSSHGVPRPTPEGGDILAAGWVAGMLWGFFAWCIYKLSKETLSHRKMLKAGTLTALLTALGVSLLLQNLGIRVFGATPRSFPALVEFQSYEFHAGLAEIGGSGLQCHTVGCNYQHVSLANQDMLIFVAMVISMLALQFIIYRTKIGKAMRAVAVDQDAARLMGISLDRTISAAFAFGSALAAVAGVLYAIRYGRIEPLMGALPGAKAFVAAVLGGIGNIPGAVLGGLIMGITESMVVGYVSSTLRDAFAFGILILILLVKPAGLLGSAAPEKV